MSDERTGLFEKSARIVIKIGSNVVTTEHNRVDTSVIEHLVETAMGASRMERAESDLAIGSDHDAGQEIYARRFRFFQRPELLQGIA